MQIKDLFEKVKSINYKDPFKDFCYGVASFIGTAFGILILGLVFNISTSNLLGIVKTVNYAILAVAIAQVGKFVRAKIEKKGE
jgi:hypothetical protein